MAREQTIDVLACDSCGCTWLYPAQLNRYSAVSVPLGMRPSSVHIDADTDVLVCAACGRAVFPQVDAFQTHGAAWKLYEDILKEISECAKKKLKPEPTIKETPAKGKIFTHIQKK